MEIKREAFAGSESKGDVKVIVKPSSNGLNINISSTLGKLFFNKIVKTVEDVINKYGLINAEVNVYDDGALDFVIRARTETAILRASQEIEKKYYMDKKNIYYKLRRTRLYIPGNNPYLMQGISYYNADGIILDLEDSVPLESKDSARHLVAYALNNVDFGKSEKMVRINPLDICGVEDLEEIIPQKPDVILIPKCESEYDVKKVLEYIEKIEKKSDYKSMSTKIMPIIESARGVDNAFAIATATDRVIALAFGAEDYTASLGIKKTKTEEELLYAKQVIVNAAKGANIQASDTVYSDIENIEGLIESTKKSKLLGFDGRGAIHPSQIEIIHNVYAPSEKEIEEAEEIINVYKKAKEEGSGVIKYKGKMIDMPVVLRAYRVLEFAKSLK